MYRMQFFNDILLTRCPNFGRDIVGEMRKTWPGCFVVSGRNPGDREMAGFDQCRDRVKRAVAEWRDEKRDPKWAMAVRFLQWGLNTRGAGEGDDGGQELRLMNERALLGVSTGLNVSMVSGVKTEEDLIHVLIACAQ